MLRAALLTNVEKVSAFIEQKGALSTQTICQQIGFSKRVRVKHSNKSQQTSFGVSRDWRQ